MHKLKLKKCCFCCTVRRGAQIWGMVHLCLCFIVIVIASIFMIFTEKNQNMLVFTPAIIAGTIYILFDAFLLIGLSRNKLNMMLAWLIWNGSIAVCVLWYMGLVFLTLILTEPLLVLGTIPPIVYLSLEVYFTIVVMTHYANLKYPPGSVLYNPISRRERRAQELQKMQEEQRLREQQWAQQR